MKIGIIKEGKVPADERVALTPEQCKQMLTRFPFLEIKVQASERRCYADSEYAAQGIPVVADVSDCDILLGIKEVPVEALVAGKTYLFFSHTIKKQPYNRKLLAEVLKKKIRLVDYETLTDPQGIRVIAFGRWAGLVGAYNGIRAYGIRYGLFDLKPAHQCFDLEEMKGQLGKVNLPAIKIVMTGGGRVAQGAMETLNGMGIRKVSPEQWLNEGFSEAVYTQLDPVHYHQPADGSHFDVQEFYQYPERFVSTFDRFFTAADLLIAAAYWDPKAPVLFSRDDMRSPSFRIRVIADITCDIDGSIPSTRRASTIADPFYDYHPQTETLEAAFSSAQHVTVMAVDNLPNELPRDASQSFGEQLIQNVLPSLLTTDDLGIVERATIAQDGQLTPRYAYLQAYAEGKE